jgi:DNA-directed RNA polymerase subunit RPC12/RpoP
MASVKCPECGERVKLREDGKPSRCAECGTTFRVKEEKDEDAEEVKESPRPRPKRKPVPAKKSSGTKIAAIVVGSLLVVGLIALGVVLIVRKGGKDGETQPVDQAKVTVDNFKSVKPGMDVAEVEGILGGSKSSSEDDMREA